MKVSESDSDMTPRDHLEDIKRKFVAGEMSLAEARMLDDDWRRRMIEESRAARMADA